MKNIYSLPPLIFLIVATVLEVNGDAIIRIGLLKHVGLARGGYMAAGALLLFGYGLTLNLAPLEFGRVVGLYIATLLVVWQVVNYFTFRTLPTLPVCVGGFLIIAGGLILTFWQPK